MNILKSTLINLVDSNTPNVFFKIGDIIQVVDDNLVDVNLVFNDEKVRLNKLNTVLLKEDIILDYKCLVLTKSGKWIHEDLYVVPLRYFPIELKNDFKSDIGLSDPSK